MAEQGVTDIHRISVRCGGIMKPTNTFVLTFDSPNLPTVVKIGFMPGRVAQSVTCLATDACLTADPGVASSIPVRSHTFVEIDHEMISTTILFPSADSFKKGCYQLQAKICARTACPSLPRKKCG